MDSLLSRWYVGVPATPASPDEGVVALTVVEGSIPKPTAVETTGFHRAMSQPLTRASDEVQVQVPPYRGKAFIPVLAWLVAHRLSCPTASVLWRVDRQQGPNSVHSLLDALGWDLTQTRQGRLRLMRGRPPDPGELPQPRYFTAHLGDARVRLDADYGVFSPTEVDAGTRLLLEVALRGPAVETVADIGTGYGPLAIGLVCNGIATRALVTDVDCVALWLAERNAASNGVPLYALCAEDPGAVEPSPLTVCNIPTHINHERTERLMEALLGRAKDGRLLTVVHASLEARYTAYFRRAGVTPIRHLGPAHVVLDSGS